MLHRIWQFLTEDLEGNFGISAALCDWRFGLILFGGEMTNRTFGILVGHIANKSDELDDDEWFEGFALLGVERDFDYWVFHLLYKKFRAERT